MSGIVVLAISINLERLFNIVVLCGRTAADLGLSGGHNLQVFETNHQNCGEKVSVSD